MRSVSSAQRDRLNTCRVAGRIHMQPVQIMYFHSTPFRARQQRLCHLRRRQKSIVQQRDLASRICVPHHLPHARETRTPPQCTAQSGKRELTTSIRAIRVAYVDSRIHRRQSVSFIPTATVAPYASCQRARPSLRSACSEGYLGLFGPKGETRRRKNDEFHVASPPPQAHDAQADTRTPPFKERVEWGFFAHPRTHCPPRSTEDGVPQRRLHSPSRPRTASSA
jgi:hypothetical protein